MEQFIRFMKPKIKHTDRKTLFYFNTLIHTFILNFDLKNTCLFIIILIFLSDNHFCSILCQNGRK